jgi:hypothetical protein
MLCSLEDLKEGYFLYAISIADLVYLYSSFCLSGVLKGVKPLYVISIADLVYLYSSFCISGVLKGWNPFMLRGCKGDEIPFMLRGCKGVKALYVTGL